jgi:hypothetical protein
MSNIILTIAILLFILSFTSAFLWTFFNIFWWTPSNYLSNRDFFIAVFHIVLLIISSFLITANVCE